MMIGKHRRTQALTSKCFDPVLAGRDEDESTSNVIKEYLGNNAVLPKKRGRPCLKADSKLECDAATTPEVDEFLQTYKPSGSGRI